MNIIIYYQSLQNLGSSHCMELGCSSIIIPLAVIVSADWMGVYRPNKKKSLFSSVYYLSPLLNANFNWLDKKWHPEKSGTWAWIPSTPIRSALTGERPHMDRCVTATSTETGSYQRVTVLFLLHILWFYSCWIEWSPAPSGGPRGPMRECWAVWPKVNIAVYDGIGIIDLTGQLHTCCLFHKQHVCNPGHIKTGTRK